MPRSEQGKQRRRERDRRLKAERAKQESSTDREARLAYSRRYYQQNRTKWAEWKRANAATVRRQKQESYLRHAERIKAQQRAKRFRRYGLSVESFDTLNRAQGGLCAICRKPPTGPRLAVDHDHATGRVRGLLCHHCNAGLGFMRDSVATLYAAIAYLAK